MSKTKETLTISKEEALKKVAEVLEEALAEYESLEKMDLSSVEDPSRPSMSAQADESSPVDEESEEEKKKKLEAESSDENEEEENEEEEPNEDEESDEDLKSKFEKMEKRMVARGLSKSEAKAPSLKKSEIVQEGNEELKKSIDDRFSMFASQMNNIQETLAKIAGQPAAPRKGVSGLSPLKKTEEVASSNLSKNQIVDKLLDLKKSNPRVNTALINRVETNRLEKTDIDFINSILA